MRVEILCTGNELLDGSVVDTNSAWIEGELFELGIEVAEKRVIPDDLATIASAMREIAARAEFCIVSGGLGPTPDDLTVEALARAAGTELVEHPETLERLSAWMRARGRELTPAHARQALVPEGATVLPNELGSAPHLQMSIGACVFALLPGVPREFVHLAQKFVLPKIGQRALESGSRGHFAFAKLRCYGIWEADMAWAVRELPHAYPGLRIGTRTMAPENHLKLRASAATQAEADAKVAAAVAFAREKLGAKVYALGETTFAAATLDKLRNEGATVAFAESLTAGLAASLLAEVPKASEVLTASFVVYQDRAKQALLGISTELLEREGAVSEVVARQMAERARERAGTTYAAAVTGFAGPDGGTERDPVGTFYAALASAEGTKVERYALVHADRERIRKSAAYAALNLLRTANRS